MDVKYPIGRPVLPEQVDMSHVATWIEDVEQAATHLARAVKGLTEEQLDTPYRPEGWTVRQVVHHLPDSHMMAYVNFRLGLTQDKPQVQAVDVDAWTALQDCLHGPIEPSLTLFAGLQARWALLLHSLSEPEFHRTIITGGGGERSLWMLLAIYAWHGQHHVAHIASLRERMGWGE
ncbi:MAG: putative metal-dependent hydrolase [Firmicutes bacterium]|nr:putative metal-dependent hydrolase [Bacillota bacterium]